MLTYGIHPDVNFAGLLGVKRDKFPVLFEQLGRCKTVEVAVKLLTDELNTLTVHALQHPRFDTDSKAIIPKKTEREAIGLIRFRHIFVNVNEASNLAELLNVFTAQDHETVLSLIEYCNERLDPSYKDVFKNLKEECLTWIFENVPIHHSELDKWETIAQSLDLPKLDSYIASYKAFVKDVNEKIPEFFSLLEEKSLPYSPVLRTDCAGSHARMQLCLSHFDDNYENSSFIDFMKQHEFPRYIVSNSGFSNNKFLYRFYFFIDQWDSLGQNPVSDLFRWAFVKSMAKTIKMGVENAQKSPVNAYPRSGFQFNLSLLDGTPSKEDRYKEGEFRYKMLKNLLLDSGIEMSEFNYHDSTNMENVLCFSVENPEYQEHLSMPHQACVFPEYVNPQEVLKDKPIRSFMVQFSSKDSRLEKDGIRQFNYFLWIKTTETELKRVKIYMEDVRLEVNPLEGTPFKNVPFEDIPLDDVPLFKFIVQTNWSLFDGSYSTQANTLNDLLSKYTKDPKISDGDLPPFQLVSNSLLE